MDDIVFSPGRRVRRHGRSGWCGEDLGCDDRARADPPACAGWVSSVDSRPMAGDLATADDSGVARVWTLDIDELVDLAKDRVTRSLTIPECRQFELADCPPAS